MNLSVLKVPLLQRPAAHQVDGAASSGETAVPRRLGGNCTCAWSADAIFVAGWLVLRDWTAADAWRPAQGWLKKRRRFGGLVEAGQRRRWLMGDRHLLAVGMAAPAPGSSEVIADLNKPRTRLRRPAAVGGALRSRGARSRAEGRVWRTAAPRPVRRPEACQDDHDARTDVGGGALLKNCVRIKDNLDLFDAALA